MDILAFKKKKPNLDQLAGAPPAAGGGALPLPEYTPHPTPFTAVSKFAPSTTKYLPKSMTFVSQQLTCRCYPFGHRRCCPTAAAITFEPSIPCNNLWVLKPNCTISQNLSRGFKGGFKYRRIKRSPKASYFVNASFLNFFL